MKDIIVICNKCGTKKDFEEFDDYLIFKFAHNKICAGDLIKIKNIKEWKQLLKDQKEKELAHQKVVNQVAEFFKTYKE